MTDDSFENGRKYIYNHKDKISCWTGGVMGLVLKLSSVICHYQDFQT